MQHHRQIDRVKTLLIMVTVFIIYGTIGYMLLENLTFTDSLLRVALTFSTLGYGEVTSQTFIGKWFTIILIAGGVSVIVYSVSAFARLVIEGEISGTWKKKMIEKHLKNFKEHIIICGFGRLGKQVAEEVATEGIPMVVIDKEDRSLDCHKLGYEFLHGDVTLDETLTKANIEQAKTLIIAIGNDSESLACAVTARALNPSLFIVARASTKHASERLTRVGVNKIAMPVYIGGYHMASMALRPSVVDFIDLVIDSKHEELQIEELQIDRSSPLVGHAVHDFFSGSIDAPSVLAIQHKDGTKFIRPAGTKFIQEGDRLILMGTVKQLDDLMQKINSFKKEKE